MHIAAQTIQLGHGDMSAKLLGLTKGSGELWALVKRAATLAGLDLDKLASNLQVFIRRKPGDSLSERQLLDDLDLILKPASRKSALD